MKQQWPHARVSGPKHIVQVGRLRRRLTQPVCLKGCIMRIFIRTAMVLLTLPTAVWAQTTTGFKTSEQSTGMTKQCYYQALGSTYTLTVSSTQLCPLSVQVPSSTNNGNNGYSSPPASPSTVTAFKTGEQTTGMTKQCFYNGLGNQYTQTISSVALCPLSIQARPGG